MKKLIALLLVLTMALALVACGGNSTPETQAPTEAAETTEAPTEEAAVPEFHQWTFEEDRGDLKVTWTLTVIGDSVFSLDEYNSMSGETTTHGLDECVIDLDAGTVDTGAWSDSDSNKSEFFAPNGACQWVITGEGAFEPANLDEVSSSTNEGGVNPGKYVIGDTGWNLMLKGSGEYALQEGESDDTLTGAQWTDNGDGTITTSALDDPSTAPEFLGGDGSGTWTIGEDGTATLG